jgi:hypothetical protein
MEYAVGDLLDPLKESFKTTYDERVCESSASQA